MDPAAAAALTCLVLAMAFLAALALEEIYRANFGGD